MAGYGHLKYPRQKLLGLIDEQQQKNREETYNEFTSKGWGGIYHKLKCLRCGNTFFAKRNTAKYCCYRCKNDAQIELRRKRNISTRNKRCTQCGNLFAAKRKDTVFCSSACKQKWYRQRHVTDKGLDNVSKPKSVTNVTDMCLADICATHNSNSQGAV